MADAPARAHVFVDDVDAPVLSSGDAHHLRRVLRLRPDEIVAVSDGAGRARPFRFGPPLEPAGDASYEPAPSPAITVAFALTKGERPEWVVQKLTEVGVDTIVPFVAARSVVRWDEGKAAREVERWRRIAREAAMQSRRVWLPEVDQVRDFATVVDAMGAGASLADLAGGAPALSRPAVLVGPEGGWSDDERACGLPVVGLGRHVLRAETAAVAAGVVLSALRAGLIGGPD